MENPSSLSGCTLLCTGLLLAVMACSGGNEPATLNQPEIWSLSAPHEPTAPDLDEKISSSRIRGGWTPAEVEFPVFESFSDPELLEQATQELIGNGLPPERVQALLAKLEDPDFQFRVNGDPNTGRLLLTTVTHSNDITKQVSEAVFSMLLEQASRLIITDNLPAGASGSSSATTIDRRIYSRASLFKGSNGEDMRADWFNEATEISYLVSGITPPSQNAQILQIILQSLYVMHDFGSHLDGNHSGSLANAGIRDNLAWLFLTLCKPDEAQEERLEGRCFNHPDAIIPPDNPSTPDFDESEINTMFELIERSRETFYSNLPDLPFQLVPNWLAEQYEALTGSPMPNGNIADQAAIDLAVEACNNFLDNRQEARSFIQAYYGVDFP